MGGKERGLGGEPGGALRGGRSWSLQGKFFSHYIELGKCCPRCFKFPLAAPWPEPRRTQAKFLGSGEGSAPYPARFRGPLPPTPRKDAGSDCTRTEGLHPEKRDPGICPIRSRSRPAFRSPPGRRRSRALTESGAGRDLWGRGRQLRLSSAAMSRPATRPQGRRPAHGSKPRGGGGGLASMARGSGGGTTKRAAVMAALTRGPSSIARASLSVPRSLQPSSLPQALAVRRVLIGRSEAGADWPMPNGRLHSSRAPPLSSWFSSLCHLGCGVGTHSDRARYFPNPVGSRTSEVPATGATKSSCLQSQTPGHGLSFLFTDVKTKARHQPQQYLPTRIAWNS